MADDTKTPFQIRAFPVTTRKLALDCAAKAGLTVGEWMDRAVHSQMRVDEADQADFPLAVAQPRAIGAAAAVEPHTETLTPRADPPAQNIFDLSPALIAFTAAVARDPRGLRAVPGLTAFLTAKVREARGLPPSRVKPPTQSVKPHALVRKT